MRTPLILATPGLALAGGMDAMGAAAVGLAFLLLVDLVGGVAAIGLTLFAQRPAAGPVARGLAWLVTVALLGWAGYVMSFGADLWRFWIGPVVVGALCAVALLIPRRASPSEVSARE